MNKNRKSEYIKISLILFSVALVWFLLDRFTKIYFDSGQFYIGQNITPSFLNLFHFTLAHNTGAAFGIFSGAASALAIGSINLSILLIALPFALVMRRAHNVVRYRISILMLFSIAIVVAGGIGNGIDRFIAGYVVDFICLDFISFPIFNIADIGVVCGIIILIINCLLFFRGAAA